METTEKRTLEQISRCAGNSLLAMLHHPKTVEIMLNPDGSMWVEQLGSKCQCFGEMNPSMALALMQNIAGFYSKELTAENPILECEFPIDGSRFAGQIPPIVSHPTFTIRKRAISIFSLENYVENSIMTQKQYETIVSAVGSHKNILVIGGTGSGKTTLVNAVIQKMVDLNPAERPVIIEDTGEIQCTAKNYVQFHTTSSVSMTDLLKTTLRMRPDRILVGEVRGPEALDLLMAWNTGHPGGAATLHANDAKSGLDRLATLITMSDHAPDQIEKLISEVVDVVICISRTADGRKIKEIISVEGYNSQANEYVVNSI